MKTVKTESVITSWMIFNCHNENGPPFSSNPILLAGTWNMYSKKATPQLPSIIKKRLTPTSLFISFSFKCPYQASVINVLEKINKTTVRSAFFIFAFLKIILSVDYFSIFHVEQPVTQLCQFFIMSYDQKCLLKTIAKVNKKIVQFFRIC